MQSLTLQDMELLAGLLQRAGVNPWEAAWANGIMDELRAMVARAELKPKKTELEEENGTDLGTDPRSA